MNRSINTIKSKNLGKDMTVIAYGDAKAYPVIAFPTQDQMADEWEKNGMLDVLAEYIDAGRIQLFTVDSNDLESWSSASTDFAARAQRQEDYFNFVIDELLPFVHKSNGTQLRPLATGCSLGATQAAIVALRRPDVIQGAIALSGMFHTSYFFGNWGNEVSYNNDVNGFLPNMPLDHPYIQMYKNRTFAFSIGQAADEQFGVDDLHFLQATFEKLGIPGWFDFWGPECNHDWFWWKQQMSKFLPEAVKEVEAIAAAEQPVKPVEQPAPAKKPAAKKAAAAKKPAAKTATGKASTAKAATKATEAETEKEPAAAKPAAAAKKTTARKTTARKSSSSTSTRKTTARKPAARKAAAAKTTARKSK